jgi:uncharacterized protein (DUF2267 family)
LESIFAKTGFIWSASIRLANGSAKEADELEDTVLQAIRDMLAGADANRASIEQAATIVRLADSVRAGQPEVPGPSA